MDTLIVSRDRDTAIKMIDVLVPARAVDKSTDSNSAIKAFEVDGSLTAWVMPRTVYSGRRFDIIMVDKSLLNDQKDREWIQSVIIPLLKRRSTDNNTLTWY